MMLKLVDENLQQLHLWDDTERDRFDDLIETLERINVEMGRGTLHFAFIQH